MHRTPIAALLALAAALPAQAAYTWNWTNLSSPDWDISVTDFGYSDYLLDHTPGFEGREYLSGEWGGALAYQRSGRTVAPTWLEPRFSFPDWDTNSNYTVLQPMTPGPLTAQGLPTARSVIGDGRIEVTQDLRIVDTVSGIPLGWAPASAGGAGSMRLSNRYVLEQRYTFRNVSGDRIDGLQYFQLLHGLTSQSGVYDNRAYAGSGLPGYRYTVTLGGDAQSAGGQFDYIGFSSKRAPSAVEIGRFGLEGVDDHVSAKPGVGTHLSVEANALDGSDHFAPAERWVAGAQRFELGSLADGESVTLDTALAILTGWQVPGGGGGGSVGSANGGKGVPGGIEYEFLGEHSAGQLFVEFEREDAQGLAERVARGDFGMPDFATPGSHLQLWEIEFEGSFADGLRVTFGFDPALVPDPTRLRVYHWRDDRWVALGGVVEGATITVEVDALSPFALGVPVPEPAPWVLMLAGAVALRLRLARRTGQSERSGAAPAA
jgi:hypothetical protein